MKDTVFLYLLSALINRRMQYAFKIVLADTHQAAPTTDREIDKPMPRLAHINGEVSVRNLQEK